MKRNEIKEFYPQLIEIIAVYGGKVEIIHGYHQGTVLKDFISDFKSDYIYQKIDNYDANPGRTLIKIKQNSMISKKYEDVINIEIENLKRDKELRIINLNNLRVSLLLKLKENYGIEEKDIDTIKAIIDKQNDKIRQQEWLRQNEENKILVAQQLERERQLKLERLRLAQLKKEEEEEKQNREWIKRSTRINKRNEEVYSQFKRKFNLLSAGDILVHKSLGNLLVDKLDDKTIYVTRYNDMVKMELARDISMTLNLKDIIKKA
jgi:hypothetical protein